MNKSMLLVLSLLLAACSKPAMPDQAPAPKAGENTQLRDSIKRPLDAAKAAAATMQQAPQADADAAQSSESKPSDSQQ